VLLVRVKANFAFDNEGNPCLAAECQIGIDESGKFKCGFGLLRNDKGQLTLCAFKDTPEHPIAFLRNKEDAIKWLEKTLEKNGYRWYHIYTSEIEQIGGLYAFMIPFDATGWVELPEDVRNSFQTMVKMLKES